MKNLIRIIFIVLLISCYFHSPVSAIAQDTESGETISKEQRAYSGFDEIARRIASLFPKVEGKILSVEEKTVRISLGRKDGVSSGMRLEIFREGKEFFHPVTKKVMGRLETRLGLIEIKEATEDSSLCLILEKKEEINTGDKVRITAGRIGIALIFTERVERDTLAAFYEAFEGTGRFRIVEDEKVKDEIEKAGLKGLGPDTREGIKSIGKKLNIEGMVFLDVKPTPKGPFLKVDLIHTFDGKPLGTYEAFITPSEKKDIELPLPERKDYWKSFDFDYKARLIGIGDLDGDGRKEIVISDGTRIRIYRFEGSNIFEIWADKENSSDNHIALDVADINGDGTAEIFVTNYGDYLRSFVIEYKDGSYKRIWNNVPLFFRVISIRGQGNTLIAQELDGKIYEYSPKEGRYVRGKPLKLLPNIDIYGFAFVDWGKKGSHDLLVIDEDDYLNLYDSEGGKIWKSKEHYGGYVLSFERPSMTPVEKNEKVKVRGRIITKDYGAEERQKAIVIRNIPLTYLFREFKGYKNAEVFFLSWNGSEIVEEWRIGKIDGFIADYATGDLTNTGKEILCLLMNPTIRIIGGRTVRMPGLGDVLSGKSYLLLYNLPKK